MTKQKVTAPAAPVKKKAALPAKKAALAANKARVGKTVIRFKEIPADATVIEVSTPITRHKVTPPIPKGPDLTPSTTGSRIRARRLELGMSLNRAAQEIGCTATTLKRWEEGDIKSLKDSRLNDIARALKTTSADLLGLQEYTVSLPGVKAVKSSKRVPVKTGSAKSVKSVNLISGTNGDVILPPDVDAEYVYTMPSDAMINARIFKGDQVYIKRIKSSEEVSNGEIALIVTDNKTLLRRVYRFQGYMDLRAENPTYPPITFEGLAQTGVEIIGKAVAFMAVL